MGKDRKGPTSSAKAAELLSQPAGGSGGFGGFSGSQQVATGVGGFAFGAKYVQQVAAAVPAARGGSEAAAAAAPRAAVIPPELDGELAQQLQKLTKRDATTKLKALQALRVLASSKPADDVVAVLPPWAYLYSRLAMDGSRSVRAEAGQAMGALAAAAGRRAAPFLRALLPPWWLAQFDVAADVAATARAAFASAFATEAKRRDALLYCRAEVLQLLADNLGSTPQTLGDAKKEPPEELVDRHERVLAATCAALAALIELAAGARAAAPAGGGGDGDVGRAAAAAEQAAEVAAGAARLLEQPSFYKQVLQSKAAPVRRSAYRAVAAAASARPPLLGDDAARAAAPAVLGAVGEREPGCHAEMWEAVLAFARAHPSAWAGINLQKAFLPRLWALLRHGCYGSGTASYLALLPLVAALPRAALGPSPGFFVSLLCALWEGLGEAGSIAAQRAAAAAYQECLLYALLRSEQLAAVNSEGGDMGPAVAAAATAAGAEYCSQLLEAALPPTVLAAATSAAAARSLAAQAAVQVLAGAVPRLAKPANASKAAAGPETRLDALLEVVGRYCVQAVQAELSTAHQQQSEAAEGTAPAAQQHPGTSLEQVSSLVAALTEAGSEEARGAVGAAVAQPLVAGLLPEVRAGEAPAAAASLLASLLKAFPQHGAAAPLAPVLTRAVSGGEGEQQPGSPSLSAGAPASAEQQFAALRLHQSASFTIDSLARQLLEGRQQQEAAALAASCDLLLACMPQVRDPACKLGEVVQQLLAQGQASTATTLLQHVADAGVPGGLTAATARSRQLDAVAATLAAGPGDAPHLLALLLVGDGRSSMLSAGVCATVLRQLGAAVGAAASGGDGAAGAALQVASAALLSPALSSHGSEEVLDGQLGVLSAAFSLLAQEAATQPAAAAADMAADESQPSGSDSEVEEAVLRQLHEQSEAGELAAGLWQQADAICRLLLGAHQSQQDRLVESLQAAVLDRLDSLQSEAADAAAAAAAVGAAGRLAAAAQQAGAALAPAPTLQQQLLRGLLLPAAAGQAYGLARAALLCSLGQSLGFRLLLGCLEQRLAAQLAVDTLAALEEAQGWLAEPIGEPLLRHVAGDASLLSAALEAALDAAEGEDDAAVDAAIVLGALLEAATEGGEGEGEGEGPPASAAGAAAFFGRRVVDLALQQEAPRLEDLHLLLVLLETCAPAFRRSAPLLHASGLPRLAAWLCERSAAVEPVALVGSGPQRQQRQQMDEALADGEGPSTSQPSQEREQEQHSKSEGTDEEALPLLLLRAAVACFPAVTTAEQVAAAGGGGDFGRGDAVWYLLPDGDWAEAAVVAVDHAVQPPSYGIQLVSGTSGGDGSGAYRETEGHRLKARRPDAPPPLPAPAPAAQSRATEPESEEHERGALRALLLHQTRGLRGAALAREEPSRAARAGVAALAHAAATYCGRDLGQQAWAAAVELSGAALSQAAAQLSAAVREVVAALCTGAMAVGGAALGSPPLALHFWRQLQQKGVLARSAKAQAELTIAVAALEDALERLQQDLLPMLLPALQTYTRAAAAAAIGPPVLPSTDWQTAEAAACAELLQSLLAIGGLAAAAAAVGATLSAPLEAWLGEAASGKDVLWGLLGRHATVVLREADRPFLLEAVDRANADVEATGIDCLGRLLGLALCAAAPSPLAGAALQALLLHGELAAALTGAEGVDEEELERQQEAAAAQSGGAGAGTAADVAAMLEQVAVRPDLAGAVAGADASSASAGALPRGPRYLEAWALLLAHLLAAVPDAHGRRLLSQTLKEAPALVPALLDALLPLLPLAPAGGRRESAGGAGASGSLSTRSPSSGDAASGAATAGADDPVASFASSLVALELPLRPGDEAQARALAEALYWGVLQALPASARLWFGELRDRGTAAAVERYTAARVTPSLLAAELAAVRGLAAGLSKYDKFSVKASAATREVVAVMEVEEGHMLELVTRLPGAMPLRPPEVECRRKVGVSEGRLRKWLLSIAALLRNQNGGVAQAIGLWKRNVDKEFEGHEECLICYSICSIGGQLPRLSCRTCKKRFHGACLYRWFRSSAKSNCPHCQSPW